MVLVRLLLIAMSCRPLGVAWAFPGVGMGWDRGRAHMAAGIWAPENIAKLVNNNTNKSQCCLLK